MVKTLTRSIVFFSGISFFLAQAYAQQPDPPGQIEGNESAENEAYLFAHIRTLTMAASIIRSVWMVCIGIL